MNTHHQTFDYDNMNLIPRKCIVDSRSECDTSIILGGRYKFNIPVVPANMECVISEELAIKLAKHGYFYIMHRFNVDVVNFSEKMRELNLPVSISIGVNDDSYEVLRILHGRSLVPDYITIDIAHGHSTKMEKILYFIRDLFRDDSSCRQPFIIAGNVSTPDGARDLELWGADAIKVGIGPGSACTTFNATGFGSRGIQASVVRECARSVKSSIIIADGGISHPGDIAKSLALGAKFVMIGGMFSGLIDSPGTVIEDTQGRKFKEFWGSASQFSHGKKNNSRIEGTKRLIPMKPNTCLEEMNYLKECLQSSISYAGGSDVSCLSNVEYIVTC